MSKLYEEGRNFFDLEEYEKAIELYSKGDAEGDVYCSLDLAAMLFEGKGVKKDEKRAKLIFACAFPFLQNLARNGDARAQEKIAHIYWEGVFVEQNCIDVMKALVKIYIKGNIVIKSYKMAQFWADKIAEIGNGNDKLDMLSM